MTSTRLTLSDTQLCVIMMRGCKKEWSEQYNADVGEILMDVDTFLKKFKIYKKLDESK